MFRRRRLRQVAAAVMLTMSIACSSASAQTTSISGSSFSGSQTFDATSGTAVITGNATLSADTTFNLGFQINYLVVGGGGGGGGNFGGGGGGGAVVSDSTFLTGVANVSVGGGGGGGVGATSGTAGANSTISTTLLGTITGTGGQGGSATGGNGGASGNGNAGGNAFGGDGGGGGGAGAVGGRDNGGNGLPWAFSGSTLFGAGGGGSLGGLGGATAGGTGGDPAGNPGGAGFGAGGGGGTNVGGDGGSGTVQFAYLGSQIGTATNGTQSAGTGSAAGYTVVSFTGTGAGGYEVTSAQLASRLAGTLTGNLTGSGGLTFAGPGTLTLTGTSTYTGATQVSVGSLYVDGQLGNTAVAVNAGTLLGGKGTILGPVTISSGTLAPGSLSSPLATLTVGNLVMSDNTTTTVMMISGSSVGQYDQVAAANVGSTSLTLAGILDLTMTGTAAGGSYDYADMTRFHLFSGFAPVSGNFSQIVLNAAGTRYDGLQFAFNSDGVWRTPWTNQSVGQYLVFDATTGELLVVPEPGTLVLAGMAIACLTAAARWRRAAGRAAGKPGGTLVQVTSPAQQTAV